MRPAEGESVEFVQPYPSHATINHEIRAVDEAALIAGKKYHGLGLLNSLSEATGGEMDFSSVALGDIVTQPVLEERCAVKRKLETVKR